MAMNGNRGLYLALCAVLGVGCGYSEEEMQAKINDIGALESELNGAREEHAELQRRFHDLDMQNQRMLDRLREMGTNVDQLQEERGEMERALEELRARDNQAQARLATFKNMMRRFQSMIESGKLRVRIDRGRMVVELAENILFDSGRADLKPEGQEALKEVALVLSSIPDRNFQVAGHTDNIPIRSQRFPSNWELSTARAVTVTRFLADGGMDTERVSAAGYADTHPVADNETLEGRQQNRRIEIVLMPNLDELPDLSSLEDDMTS